ncbi:hypothetical protein SORBI_3003G261766 [Sorghum bicolor]|uniref:Uncharacterized protein n=1 Tax=Sorghum bicolor TaxID=4558 RepID=A0A1W0VZ08_SORBI|nr:hypothetical protein SORBI_3003G261766 [Sorghum bicolor]
MEVKSKVVGAFLPRGYCGSQVINPRRGTWEQVLICCRCLACKHACIHLLHFLLMELDRVCVVSNSCYLLLHATEIRKKSQCKVACSKALLLRVYTMATLSVKMTHTFGPHIQLATYIMLFPSSVL